MRQTYYKMIKAIFFDIDGTLISFKTHQMPESTLKALNALREKGIKLFISSGRPEILIHHIDFFKFDAYILMNGAVCYTGDHDTIYRSIIPEDDLKRLIEYSKESPHPFVFVYGKEWFITHTNKTVDKISQLIDIPAPPIRPIKEALQHNVSQIMGYFPQEADEEVFGKILTHCQPMRWHPDFTDITVKGTSKSSGMDKILEYYNIPLEDCMAFGDGGNDIHMLEHAAIGVAMGNAEEKVKAVADYVTASVDDDGLYKALIHFGCIDQ